VSGDTDPRGTPPLLWLNDPQCQDQGSAGNKAANLARLLRLGYDVPDGFSVTTTAIAAGAGSYAAAVAEALARLESPWATRSSSTAEDSPGHAFPGLFTTLLGLDDTSSLLAAIEEVHASASSDVMRRYADRLGVDPDAVRMAVLVQRLVPASVAGVAFSRAPDSRLSQVVIEANYGLGETVVEGSVTPDSFTVGASGEILDRSLGSKRQKVVAAPGGERPRRVDVGDGERSAFALDDERVAAVAEVARRLEADLGHPVDVEWAFAGDRLYVLQARPISTMGHPVELHRRVG
jgi:phosphoenolpyruvate synthase/pyruvate phosphate dikinase